jgi:hypothetical protein
MRSSSAQACGPRRLAAAPRQGILVSPRMVDDHYSSTLAAALRSATGADGGGAAAAALRYFPPSPAMGPNEGDGTLPA